MRAADVQRAVDAARVAFAARAPAGSPVARLTDRIFTALEEPSAARSAEPARLPVCRHMERALSSAEAGPQPVAALARALRSVEPRLVWTRRTGADPADPPFFEGHANAILVGRGGLEVREDVLIGVTLMAPDVRYVDHRHPPEEAYVALTQGAWRKGEGPWEEPGVGGLVHNPPDVVHAMRSGSVPFLALWALWTAPA